MIMQLFCGIKIPFPKDSSKDWASAVAISISISFSIPFAVSISISIAIAIAIAIAVPISISIAITLAIPFPDPISRKKFSKGTTEQWQHVGSKTKRSKLELQLDLKCVLRANQFPN